MTENVEQNKLQPEKRPSNGQFLKGQSGNPKGKPKGALSKTTKFRQVMTSHLQDRAVKVLKKVVAQAESGDKDSQKMVLTLLAPFIKREAEKDGAPKNKRPLVNIIVNKTDGRAAVPLAAQVIDHED